MMPTKETTAEPTDEPTKKSNIIYHLNTPAPTVVITRRPTERPIPDTPKPAYVNPDDREFEDGDPLATFFCGKLSFVSFISCRYQSDNMRSVKGPRGIKPLPSVLTAAHRARRKNVQEMGRNGRAMLSRHARVLGRTQKQRPSQRGSQPNDQHQVSRTFSISCFSAALTQLLNASAERLANHSRTPLEYAE